MQAYNGAGVKDNTQNIDNSVNITIFNADPEKTTKFDKMCTHLLT